MFKASSPCYSLLWMCFCASLFVTCFGQSAEKNSSFSMVHQVEELYKKNIEISNRFRCALPQPRAFSSKHVFRLYGDVDIHISTMDIVDPADTVLHRCEQSGCCGITRTCKMFSQEIVRLYFRIVQSPSGIFRYESVEVSNHTSCSCQSAKEKIKRLVHE